jgi:hypothetical protein
VIGQLTLGYKVRLCFQGGGAQFGLTEWESSGRRLAEPVATSDINVNELVLAYWKHAQVYYGWTKNPQRGDRVSIRDVLRVIRKLYGHTSARDFGPLALKACRARMIQKGWARTYINLLVAARK